MNKIILSFFISFTVLGCKNQSESGNVNSEEIADEVISDDSMEKEIFLTDLEFSEKHISKQLQEKVKDKNPDGKLFSLQSFDYENGYLVLVSDFKSTQAFLYYYNTELSFLKRREIDIKFLKDEWAKIKVN